MPLISFTDAWQAYRRAEPRLPAKPAPVTPTRVPGIGALIEHFDLVILDSWGVLNLGDHPITGAREAVAALRRSGMPLLALSNDASGDKTRAVANHRRRGYDFAASEVIHGLDLLPETLARLALARPVGLIADPPVPMTAITGALQPLADDEQCYDDVSGVVFLSADRWTSERQEMLRRSLTPRRRPLIVCNPDIASPNGDTQNAEPGFYAHRLAEEIGIQPIFCGKPFPEIYRRALAAFPGIRRERVLCVGDTLHTDILGARAAGLRAMLVENGFVAGRDALSLASESGIWPDFIAPRL